MKFKIKKVRKRRANGLESYTRKESNPQPFDP